MFQARTKLAAGLAVFALSAAACGSSDGGGGTVKLNAANLLPPADAQSEMIQWFMDELELRTDGEVETEVVHGGALLAGNDTLQGIQQGRADSGNVVHAYFPADLPLHNINTVPVNGDQSARLRAFQETADKVQAWQDELEANDLVLIGFLPNTSSSAAYGSPVESVDQLDGLSMRVPSQNEAVVWEEFGVEPTFMPADEVYEAVERNIVDGTFYPMGTQVSTGVTDVAKVMTPGVGQSGSGTFAFSQRSYDRLSDRAKEVVAELQEEWYVKADEMLAKYESEACDEFLVSGGQVNMWSDEDMESLADAMPFGADVWRQAAEEAGADPAAIDEVWETFSTAVEQNNGQTGYTDGLAACADRQ